MSMQALEKKRFIAYWGEGYPTEEVKIVDEDYFTEEQGYRPEHIKEIRILQPLQLGYLDFKEWLKDGVADLTEMGAVHLVIRVK